MRSLGIDASLTGTGIVLLNGTEHNSKQFKPTTTDIERLLEIEKQIISYLDYAPDIICIEGYAFGRSNRAHHMGELGGILRRRLYLSGHHWIEIPPKKLKKFVAGNGNASKEVVLLNVFKRWGIEFTNSDEADAFALAKMGAIILGQKEKLTKIQQEVVKDIKKTISVKLTA